jgi:uncharacterized protein (TIGR00725 family)
MTDPKGRRRPGPGTPYVAVVGPSDATEEQTGWARSVGQAAARRGWVVVTGGYGGVMQAAAEGADAEGGTAVAMLSGSDRSEASPGHAVVVATGMGEMRNALIVRSVDAVLAVGPSWGTLSEVALAARTGVPVVTLGSWDPGGGKARAPAAVTVCDDVAAAVRALESVVGRGQRGR